MGERKSLSLYEIEAAIDMLKHTRPRGPLHHGQECEVRILKREVQLSSCTSVFMPMENYTSFRKIIFIGVQYTIYSGNGFETKYKLEWEIKSYE